MFASGFVPLSVEEASEMNEFFPHLSVGCGVCAARLRVRTRLIKAKILNFMFMLVEPVFEGAGVRPERPVNSSPGHSLGGTTETSPWVNDVPGKPSAEK